VLLGEIDNERDDFAPAAGPVDPQQRQTMSVPYVAMMTLSAFVFAACPKVS
jgi:hypothetical protein